MGKLLKDIPGLEERVREASRVEDALRDLPFLGIELEICGVPVKQFAPRHFIYLDAVGNPFLAGGQVLPEHVAQFLWVVSPSFVPGQAAIAARDAFVESIAHVSFVAAVAAIHEYLDQAFMDRPDGGHRSAVPVTGFVAALVDRIASGGYGWSRDTIIDLPFAELYQYLRRIEMREDPKATFVNRLSDRARREAVLEDKRKQKGEK